MGGCGSCCHKVRPRYKEHVRNIYPKNLKTTDTGKPVINFRPLIQYVTSYPKDLPRIAKYLAKQIQKDLSLRDYDDVRIGCEAFLALMDACHSEHTSLSLYDQYVRQIITLMFEDKNADCKILGCILFNKFISFHDQRSDYNKLEPFFKNLVDLCTYNKKKKRNQVWKAGMQSLIKMVQINLDRNTVEHLHEIIPAVLNNFVLSDQEHKQDHKLDHKRDLKHDQKHEDRHTDAEEKQKSMDELSRECLEQIAAVATLVNLQAVVSPIFDYLDQRQWFPPELPFAALKTIVDCANIQNATVFLSLLTMRMDAWASEDSQSLPTTTRIVETTRELILTMRLDVGSGSFVQNLRQQLVSSVQEDEDQLEVAIIQCIGAYLYRIQNFSDSVDTIKEIISQAPLVEARQKRSLLRAACHAARLCPAFPDSSSLHSYNLPMSFTNTLVKLLAETKDCDVKILVNGILQNLLLPSELLQLNPADIIAHADKDQKMFVFLNRLNDNNNPLPALPVYLDESQFACIKQGIYGSLSESVGNDAGTVQSCFRTLIILLHMGDHSDFINQMPMIFKMQEHAINIRPSSPQHSLRLHTFVVAYILFIARVFANLSGSDVRRHAALLDERINEIIKQREDAGQICPDLVVASDVGLKAINHHQQKLILKPIDIFVDENEIIGILHQFPVHSMSPSEIRERLGAVFDSSIQPRHSPDRPILLPHINGGSSRNGSILRPRTPSTSEASSYRISPRTSRSISESESSEDGGSFERLVDNYSQEVNTENRRFKEFMSTVDVTKAPYLGREAAHNIELEMAAANVRTSNSSEIKTHPSMTVDTTNLTRRSSALNLPDPVADLHFELNGFSEPSGSNMRSASSPLVMVATQNSSTLELKFPKLSPLEQDENEQVLL